jgi:hypothetical protein
MLFRKRNFGETPKAGGSKGRLGLSRTAIALAAALSLALPLPAVAASPELETVVKASRQRIEALDYRATGRITKIDGGGKRATYKFAAKAHWFPDGLKLLAEISGPGAETTTLLAHLTATGRLTIEAMLPGEKTLTALPFERWNEPLAGTDFSYEDMVESQFFWKSQELLPSAKYGARDCFVLKSAPGPQDRSHYDSATSWIDTGILIPVQVAKTVHGTGQQKEFTYFGLRQTSGVWSAAQVEAKLPGKPGSSILVIEAGSPKAHLAAKDFELGGTGQ